MSSQLISPHKATQGDSKSSAYSFPCNEIVIIVMLMKENLENTYFESFCSPRAIFRLVSCAKRRIGRVEGRY